MLLDETMFEVEAHIEKNSICAEIIQHNIVDNEEIEYAFYLMKDGKKIEVKYYSKSNTTVFQLEESGEYSIVGFIKYKEEKAYKSTRRIEFSFDPTLKVEEERKNIPISIFGSCVSRDIFEEDSNKVFSLKTYVARHSIVSAVSKGIECNLENIMLSSKFKKEAVYHDFIKDSFQRLASDHSDYLLLDLIDERFDLIECNINGRRSIVTYSAELQESNYLEKFKVIKKTQHNKKFLFNRGHENQIYLGRVNLKQYLDKFCEEILKIYKPSNVIIHRARMLDYYIGKDGKVYKFKSNYIRNNKKVNMLIEYMYDYIADKLVGCKIIDLCDNFYADENHKWGLAPMHYQKEYYTESFLMLKTYICQSKQS